MSLLINSLIEDNEFLKINTKTVVLWSYICVYVYIYTYIHKNLTLWIIYEILKPEINNNKILKLKPAKSGFAEEKCLTTDINLKYWSMEMVIQREPAFTLFYSFNATLYRQHFPVLDVGYSPWPASGRPLLRSKILS